MKLAHGDYNFIDQLKLQLNHARTSYAMALKMASSEHPMRYLSNLFKLLSFPKKRFDVKPYEQFLENISIGYEKSDSFKVIVGPALSNSSGEQGDCDFWIEVVGDGKSDWLSLQIKIDWQFIRNSRGMTFSVFGNKELKNDTRKTYNEIIQVFFYDTNSVRQNMLPNVPFVLPENFGHVRADVEFHLPTDQRIDFDKPPVLAVLMSPHVRNVYISDIYIEFKN